MMMSIRWRLSGFIRRRRLRLGKSHCATDESALSVKWPEPHGCDSAGYSILLSGGPFFNVP
jgi:hypothetical protein